jgi:hypothetical protein
LKVGGKNEGQISKKVHLAMAEEGRLWVEANEAPEQKVSFCRMFTITIYTLYYTILYITIL